MQSETAPEEPLGHVLSVNGSQASVGILARQPGGTVRSARHRRAILVLRSGASMLIGVITAGTLTEIQVAASKAITPPRRSTSWAKSAAGRRFDLLPARRDQLSGDRRPGSPITSRELRLIYDISGSNTINVGTLLQDPAIGAYIHVEEMLRKHFAVLGTTGVGKSSGVAVILQEILAARPDLRIFLLDGHNEYGRCFGDRALVLNPRNLKLPFWLFNFEEIVDVIFGARPGVEEEVEILSEVIPLAKGVYTQYKGTADRVMLKKTDPKTTGFTVDTPVPYRLADLVAADRRAHGQAREPLVADEVQPPHHPHRDGQERPALRLHVRERQCRRRHHGGGAGPAVPAAAERQADHHHAARRLSRPTWWMRWSRCCAAWRSISACGATAPVPLLFVCEEAHRYASADRSIGFGPTRKAISRIAKEGRKYGVFLGLVTQRPAELDATIISQCSTLFAMRMANDRDQALLRSAVSDAAANLLAFVPSLGTREVLAFGEGVALPTRLKFKEVPQHLLPKSEAVSHGRIDPERDANSEFIESVIERWRGATMSHKQKFEDGFVELEMRQDAAPLQPAATLDPERFKLLKKPIDAR